MKYGTFFFHSYSLANQTNDIIVIYNIYLSIFHLIFDIQKKKEFRTKENRKNSERMILKEKSITNQYHHIYLYSPFHFQSILIKYFLNPMNYNP